MHRITATPGGWTPETEGVILLEQSIGDIIILTSADTEIQTLAHTIFHLPNDFPSIRVGNLLHLQQPFSIDHYKETLLTSAKIIILRLLGGISYWSYGLEIVKETVQETGAILLVLSGDDTPDPELMSHSTLPLIEVNQFWRYLIEGGVENYANGLKYLVNISLQKEYFYLPPQPIPKIGLYQPFNSNKIENYPRVGILFYRAHYLAGNLAVIDAIYQSLVEKKLAPVAVYISSLRERDLQEEILTYFYPQNEAKIAILLNTTSFALGKVDQEEQPLIWKQLNIPILQVILSSSLEETWENSYQGLTSRDMAMNVALPEVDGRIITRAVSFKTVQTWDQNIETNVVTYQPRVDRIDFVTNLAYHWVKLRETPVFERKIALILANYPTKDGRIANGVGLDTPASCIEILKALQLAGYDVRDIPETGDELIKRLTEGITNDLEHYYSRKVNQALPLSEYLLYFESLPQTIKQQIRQRWGDRFAFGLVEGELVSFELEITYSESETGNNLSQNNTYAHSNSGSIESSIPLAGIQLGKIFIGIQPSRGYDLDPSLNYHAPDLEPTPYYLAYYYWLREKWKTQAIIHVGKHGNLEWLPGKSIALSQNCYPEITLDSIPHIYPFIVNDPGEGSQAKRRSHAIIIDHLTPPLTRAELYGSLLKLESLIDEYYSAESLNPSRLPIIQQSILELVKKEHLDQDLGVSPESISEIETLLSAADGYLCELKSAQIRNGLHIFGKCPEGELLEDLVFAIARYPHLDYKGLTQALADDLQLDCDPLTLHPSTTLTIPDHPLLEDIPSHTAKDILERVDRLAQSLIHSLLTNTPLPFFLQNYPQTQKSIHWVKETLIPRLQQTPQEITNTLRSLNGEYIAPAPSGAPTRGKPEVLPTGRNFYSVDIRGIPTETAWDVGRKSAEALIERYTQENGEYPRSLALSVWGTSTMRTGGDDIAQAFALMGVKPVWDGVSRRVVDFEILSPSVLGRPRVDVTLRVSGFFRDSFPIILNLYYQIVETLSTLTEENAEINPIRGNVLEEKQQWETQGISPEVAEKKALHRIFSSKPGAYGAGLQGLIESQNWTRDEDLANAYINWSCYAYSPNEKGMIVGQSDPSAFKQRLSKLEVILHNQDNREHDLLDSDDYYQFQGGLTVATRAIQGKNPTLYFGDHSISYSPKIKSLKEEIMKVYRSRVINPKWIQGIMRHGYKGAFELSATVDYLFAYSATTHCVENYMYEGVTTAYLLDEKVRQFIQQKNPWVLKDIAERLLEAQQRGLWTDTSPEMVESLRAIIHQAEGILETMI